MVQSANDCLTSDIQGVMRKDINDSSPMLILKSFCTTMKCFFILLLTGLVSAGPAEAADPPTSLLIDSAQRREIQSILDSLQTAPEIESVTISRETIEELISTYAQQTALVEKEIRQLETALQGVINTSPDRAAVANSALSGLISLKQQKERELVELRLLMITAEEALAQLDQYLRNREARDTYFRGFPLWRLLDGSMETAPSSQGPSGTGAVKGTSLIIFLATVSGLFLLMATIPRLIDFVSANSSGKNSVRLLLTLISRSSLTGRAILTLFTALSAAAALALFVFDDWPGLSMGIQVIFIYLIFRLLLQTIMLRFQAPQQNGSDRLQAAEPGWTLYIFSLISAVIITRHLGFGLRHAEHGLEPLIAFIFLVCWCVLFYLFCRTAVKMIVPAAWKYISRTLLALIFFSIVLELLGYRNFNAHLASALGSSFTIFCIALIAYDSVKLLTVLARKPAEIMLKQLGLSPIERGPGARVNDLLGLVLRACVVITAAVLIFHRWSVGGYGDDRLMTFFLNGWSVGGFSFSPARISMAMVLFILAWPTVGYLMQFIDRRWLSNTDLSSSGRDTVLTLAGYGGYAAVILIALGMAGLRLTGLTVIIGALSVGIGFGLQNVVNNFISGLILMFERPIKRGDWIQVGTTEGYVKKISIRSTIVQTFDRSDVIVPNSELISNQVTNMMLDDQRGRLRISVGVAYGSDTELVQRLLLEVAQAHEQVILDGSAPEPRALFQAFGDSSLNFDLLVHLKDIDLKIRVRSEMHTLIDKSFRTHGVEIPFPQRDVHIKGAEHSSQEDWT
jgi:potassium efflux system protein